MESASGYRHHHLVCIKCGMVISFRDNLSEGPEGRNAGNAGFRVVDYEVRLRGFCVECGGDFIEEKRE